MRSPNRRDRPNFSSLNLRRVLMNAQARLISAPAILFLINLYLIHPAFLLNLNDINPWDEAAYIHSGRTLLEGNLPSFASNPLVAIFYALTYLPFRASPLWMIHSASLGRLLLFTLLWLSAYLIARQLSDRVSPLVLVGIVLVTPLAVDMLRFPSDPLFAGLAGFSFWGLLRFHASQDRRWLGFASLALGLAALARNDGLVLFPVFALLSLLTAQPARVRGLVLGAATAPFLALVGGYLLLYGGTTGNFELGTLKRTYVNFEAGHQVIYTGTGSLDPVIESKLEARRVFGTPQENQYSVFKAIRRNPDVYLQRLWATLRSLPQAVLRAYGIRFAALLLPLAARGIWTLVRSRQTRLLAAFILWPAHLVTGFVITLFRQGHLQFPFYIVFGLAAMGLNGLLANLNKREERYPWFALLGSLAIYGVLDNKLAIYYGAAVFLLALLTIHWATARFKDLHTTGPVALLILLGAGIIIRGDFPAPKVRTVGQEAKEQAVMYMVGHLKPGTKVAAGSPGVVWAASMTYAGLTSTDVPVDKSSQDFLDWMVRQEIQAVYVDHTLYNTSPAIWDLIKGQIGSGVERVFSADDGDIQILIIDDSLGR